MFDGINEGDVISAIVVIKSVLKQTTKSSNEYLKLTVNDGKRDIPVFVWDIDIFSFKVNDIVKLKGTYSKFNDKDKIDAISFEKTNQKIKLPSLSKNEINEYIEKYYALRKKIKDEDFSNLLDEIFDPKNHIWEQYITAPAAKGNHEAYLGGLLQHSITVTEIALSMKQHVSEFVNQDLLITGCLLHDIGKIKEYEYSTCIDRTTSGKLIGHVSLGVMIVSRLLPNDFPIKKSNELFHLILSHQGKKEWGSLVEPLMKEAVILHQSDMVGSYSGRFDKNKNENKNSLWSNYDENYNRSWYLGSTIK